MGNPEEEKAMMTPMSEKNTESDSVCCNKYFPNTRIIPLSDLFFVISLQKKIVF